MTKFWQKYRADTDKIFLSTDVQKLMEINQIS